MNKEKVKLYAIAILRIYLALIFILSGLDKINNLDIFAESILNYKILPIYMVNIFAVIIPWIEVISGAFLLLGIFIKENSIIIFSLLLIFTTAVIIALLKGLNIECGCMGTADGQRIGLIKVAENLFYLGISFISFITPRHVLTFIKQ